MRTVWNMIVISIASSVCLAAASTPEDRVTFYEVPLTCPAAKGLGCGSAAKPILLELERDPVIDEAWLNKAGTTLAIVWSLASAPAARATALAAIAGPHGVTLQELTGKARREALGGFEVRERWYRGATVDRLSEEEAAVIADRLLHRLTTSLGLGEPHGRDRGRGERDPGHQRVIDRASGSIEGIVDHRCAVRGGEVHVLRCLR